MFSCCHLAIPITLPGRLHCALRSSIMFFSRLIKALSGMALLALGYPYSAINPKKAPIHGVFYSNPSSRSSLSLVDAPGDGPIGSTDD
jgi:hypothetical protein